MEARRMMGLASPGDHRVTITVRDWNAAKHALWRCKTALYISANQAIQILDRCAHTESCPGEEDELAPCLSTCPDRENRMSALVVLNAARMFAPVNARKVDEPYFAPTREAYSEVIAELAYKSSALDAALQALRDAGIDPPAPQPNVEPDPLLGSTKELLLKQFEKTKQEPNADGGESADDEAAP